LFDVNTGLPLHPPPPRFDPFTGARIGPAPTVNLNSCMANVAQQGDPYLQPSTPSTNAVSFKPPYVRLTDSILDMIIRGVYFPLSALCTRKMHAMLNKGSNAATSSFIGNLHVRNEDQATNIDQDHKKYGTWEDFVDGWLHYILLLVQLNFSSEIIQDRISTLRWLTEADYQPQSKLRYWFEVRTKFPQAELLWMKLKDEVAMMAMQFLIPFVSHSGYHRSHPQADPSPRPEKKRKKPKGRQAGKQTSALVAAQGKALKALNKGLAKPMRLCHSSNSNKACSANPCTYAHVCIKCAGDHSKVDCSLP
jgi:hypothetical protein